MKLPPNFRRSINCRNCEYGETWVYARNQCKHPDHKGFDIPTGNMVCDHYKQKKSDKK